MNYRPDIDGLRALAVLSVLVFHTNENYISGGFVGVDIFFVISGYLITKLIFSELAATNDFSFKTFYLRRARRLFPALFFTFVLSFIFAYALFSPQDLADFGESVVYAVASVSNILFWMQTDYFDQSNLFKPLLHTWSLAIEEQFYFIWPALLWFLYSFNKPKLLLVSVLLLGAASLALNNFLLLNEDALAARFAGVDARSSLFYLLPFRVFEFAIGAILVWLTLPTRSKVANRGFLNEILFLAGLALIAYSLFAFNGQTTFPSFNALIPCVGAALVIASGPDHRLVGILSNRLMVATGLISYSLYLIHWPVIVFYHYWKLEPFTALDSVLIIVVSIVIAMAMYRWVEQPFRKPRKSIVGAGSSNNRSFVVTAISLAAVLCGVAWNAHSSSGWLWRYPAEVVKQLEYKRGDYSEFFWSNMTRYERPFEATGRAKVLIIGDSMGADLLNAIVEGGHAEQLDLSVLKVQHNCRGLLPLPKASYRHLFGGQKDICLKEHQRIEADPRLAQADAIILASYWWEEKYVSAIDKTIAKLKRDYSAKVFLAGIKTQSSHGILFFTKNLMTPQMHKLRTPPHPQTLNRNHQLKKIDQGYVYLNLMDQFCNESGCQRVMQSGHVIIFDDSHLSPKGAKYVGEELDQTAWFQALINSKP